MFEKYFWFIFFSVINYISLGAQKPLFSKPLATDFRARKHPTSGDLIYRKSRLMSERRSHAPPGPTCVSTHDSGCRPSNLQHFSYFHQPTDRFWDGFKLFDGNSSIQSDKKCVLTRFSACCTGQGPWWSLQKIATAPHWDQPKLWGSDIRSYSWYCSYRV